MAKIIRLTDEHIKQCYDAIATESGKRTLDGKFSLSKTFDIPNQKANVYFTSVAWCKMSLLLDQFEKEVGWYGVASRLGDEGNNEYLISDIVVYPQSVSAATVEMDEEEYSKWLLEHDEDKYYSLFMHGHSHVRMGCTPSSTDLDHQQKIVNQLPEDGFYIFMIYNKSLQNTVSVFDMKKNVHFEDKDISIGFYDDNVDYAEFIKESKDHVSERVVATPVYGKGTPKPAKPVAQKSAQKTEDFSKKNAIQNIRGYDRYGGFNYFYDDAEDTYWDSATGTWISGEEYRNEWRKSMK